MREQKMIHAHGGICKGGYEMNTGEKPEVKKQPKSVIGKVVNCVRLNIREHPSTNAKSICTVTANTELLVNTNQPNGEWTKVRTKTGTEGFCMTQYIKIEHNQ